MGPKSEYRSTADSSSRMICAAELSHALGGRKVGSQWKARCPAHDDRTPSLSICEGDDGKVLVHCHAGCEQKQVIAALRDRGLWATSDQRYRRQTRQFLCNRRDSEDVRPSAEALAIWDASVAAPGTLVETYLRSRGLRVPPPKALRFHAGLWHPAGVWPAMVALVTGGTNGSPVAIHRTYLAHDGIGKAPIDSERKMLGPCLGGSVRLGPLGDVLMVGEGLETCLSAMQASGRTAWAALSTSGLRALELPREIRDVIVLADGDEPGEAAALDCARRWRREERRVRIARPPAGMDFNDLLKTSARSTGENA
jgi:putative DNA primase/helicase